MGVTKYILKHPVTTVMALLCLVVFGISSVFSAKLEQMPDMETPMLIIMANYSGAGPEDISELVTEPIEDAIGTLFAELLFQCGTFLFAEIYQMINRFKHRGVHYFPFLFR